MASQTQSPAKPLFRGLSRELTLQREKESDSEQGVTPIIATLQRSPLPPQQLPKHPAPATPSTSEGGGVIQAKGETTGDRPDSSVEQRPNETGMPDELKVGIESLSGYSLDDVRVHYNSSKPAQLQALAYTQGTEIHVGPGQEKHLAHEAWHVVQQMQGRVKPTMQIKGGVNINDDKCLEKEADMMGAKADTKRGSDPSSLYLSKQASGNLNPSMQMYTHFSINDRNKLDGEMQFTPREPIQRMVTAVYAGTQKLKVDRDKGDQSAYKALDYFTPKEFNGEAWFNSISEMVNWIRAKGKLEGIGPWDGRWMNFTNKGPIVFGEEHNEVDPKNWTVI